MKRITILEQAGLRRLLTAGIGVGILVMGIDAGVAHFAGRAMKHAGQVIPLVFGPIAFIALALLLRTKRHRRTYDTVARTVGALTAVVGVLGSAYHFGAFLRFFHGQGFTMELTEMALMLAPPLMAPGAFIGLGAVLFLLASHKVTVTVRPMLPAPSTAC